MIDWKRLSDGDAQLIGQIAERAMRELDIKNHGDLLMDVTAAHLWCPLDLKKLLNFPKFDFAHDIYGIQRHLDRTEGVLTGCFLPRCSVPNDTKAIGA